MLATLRRWLRRRRSRSSCWNPGVSEPAALQRHPGTARRVARVRPRSDAAQLRSAGSPSDDTPDDIAYQWVSSVAIVVQFGLMLGILLAHRDRPAEARGLRAPTAGVVEARRSGSLSSCLVAIYVFVARVHRRSCRCSATSTRRKSKGSSPTSGTRAAPAPFIAFFLAVTLLAPVVEELTYRGLGFSLLLAVRHRARDRRHRGALRARARPPHRAARPHVLRDRRRLAASEDRTASIRRIVLHAAFNGIALLVVGQRRWLTATSRRRPRARRRGPRPRPSSSRTS